MSRSLIIGITTTLLIFVGLGVFFYMKYVKVKNRPVYEAIPNSAAFFVETDNLKGTYDMLQESSTWISAQKFKSLSGVANMLLLQDSILSGSAYFNTLLTHANSSLSVHVVGSDLHVVLVTHLKDADNFADELTSLANSQRIAVKQRLYEKVRVYDLAQANGEKIGSVVNFEGFVVYASTGVLIEEAIRKLKFKLFDEWKGIEYVYALASSTSFAHLYINYKRFEQFAKVFIKPEYAHLVSPVNTFAAWSMLDLTDAKTLTHWKGISTTNDTAYQYLDVFKNQQPVFFENIHAYVPKQSAFIISIGFSNYDLFRTDLTEYFLRTNQLTSIKQYQDSVDNALGVKSSDLAMAFANNAVIGSLPLGADITRDNYFAIVSISSVPLLTKTLTEIHQNYTQRSEQNGLPYKEFYSGNTIQQLHIGKTLGNMLGLPFGRINNPFYTVIDNMLYLTNDAIVLKQLIDNYRNNQQITIEPQYVMMHEKSGQSGNLSLYINTANSYSIPSDILSTDIFSKYVLNKDLIMQFASLQVQFASSNEQTFYTELTVNYDSEYAESTRQLWELQLDTALAIPPQFIWNDSNSTYDIMVQDLNNNLYYVSNEGVVKWKTKLSSRILSEIYSIPGTKGAPTRYLFNTEKSIALINAKGQNTYGYPVSIPGKCIAPITLVDLYGDSNYRYFIALENKRIVGYDINGKLLPLWNPYVSAVSIKSTPTIGLINNQPHYFVSLKDGSLVLFDDKNKQIKHSIPKSDSVHPYYVSPATNNTLFLVDSTSNRLDQIEVDSMYAPIRTITLVTGVAGKRISYWNNIISVEDSITLQLYNREGKALGNFTKTNKLYRMHPLEDQMWAVISQDTLNSQVEAYSPDGRLWNSFPLESSGKSTIKKVRNDGAYYLATEQKGKYLVFYRLK